MIAPEFRACAPMQLVNKSKKFLEDNHGSDLQVSVAPSLQEVDKLKADLCEAQQYRNDPEQLKKYTDKNAQYYTFTMCLNKCFPFGDGQLQID